MTGGFCPPHEYHRSFNNIFLIDSQQPTSLKNSPNLTWINSFMCEALNSFLSVWEHELFFFHLINVKEKVYKNFPWLFWIKWFHLIQDKFRLELVDIYCMAPRSQDPDGPWAQAQWHGPIALNSAWNYLQRIRVLGLGPWTMLDINFPNNQWNLIRAYHRMLREHHYWTYSLELKPSSKAIIVAFQSHLNIHL